MPPKSKRIPPIIPSKDGSGFRSKNSSAKYSVLRQPVSTHSHKENTEENSSNDEETDNASELKIEKRTDRLQALRPPDKGNNGHKKKAKVNRENNAENSRQETLHTSGACNSGTTLRSVGVKVDASLAASSCALSPSLFKNLNSQPLALLEIFSDNNAVYCESILRMNGTSNTVYLSEYTAGLLGTEVSVRSLCWDEMKNFATQVIASVAISVKGSSTDIEPPPASDSEWVSLLRSKFRHRVIFLDLTESITWCSRTIVVTVEKILCNVEETKYAILTDRTEILVGSPHKRNEELHPNIKDSNCEPRPTEPIAVSNSSPEGCTKFFFSLFLGASGVGKTFNLKLKQLESSRKGRRVLSIRVADLPQGENSEVSTTLVIREMFERAKQCVPSTVIMDDLHLICNTAQSSSISSKWVSQLIVHAVCEEMKDIHRRNLDVHVFASSLDKESLDTLFFTENIFEKNLLYLKPPQNAEERVDCLKVCFEELGLNMMEDFENESALQKLREIAEASEAFTQRDFFRLADYAYVEATKEGKTSQRKITSVHMEQAARSIRPSALQQFDVSVPTVTWDDIGGSEDAKKILQDITKWCLGKQNWVFEQFSIAPPKGVLLFGPPGCSKTMLAKALANESHMNFISVKGPEVFSKWVGDSEKAVRNIFERARDAAPCIVFIDELDGMCGHRGGGGVSDRVISQFLTELDGMPSAFSDKSNALVFVAATNRPDSIDAAVLRPGRIDKCVYIGLPAEKERQSIAEINLKRVPTDSEDYAEYVAQRTEGYTGAEVVAVIKEASFAAVLEDTNAEFLTKKHIDAALQKVQPRIKSTDVEWYKKWLSSQRKQSLH